jgi:Flp pilus assembly protein TadG
VPLLFIIIFGIIEFGRMLMVEQMLANAARAGVREAVLSGAKTTAALNTNIISSLTSAGVTAVTTSQIVWTVNGVVGADVSTVDLTPNVPVSVTITVPFSQVSWAKMIFQSSLLRGQCTMRKES